MQMPTNAFKNAIRAQRPQIGLWLSWASPYVTEALAGSGFDWLLIDTEHTPNDVPTVLAQLQALAPYPVTPVVRVAQGSAVEIKQMLETGVQTLLVPMVDTAEQAAALAAAMRYPPRGIRGVGYALGRSSRWGRVEDYASKADDEMCLLVQVETIKALSNLDAIASVPGVDGVFFGHSDLAASMGLLGQADHDEVHRAVRDGIARVRALGKAAGVILTDPARARAYLDDGAMFVAVGIDVHLLVRAAGELAQSFGVDRRAEVRSLPPRR